MWVALAIVGAALVVALGVVLFVRRRQLRDAFKLDIGNAVPTAAGGSDTSTETGFHRRLVGLQVFSGTIIGVLIARLWSMQLVASDD